MSIDVTLSKTIQASHALVSSVILDVEKYSEFIPWCSVKVESNKVHKINTQVAIAPYPLIKYIFTCKVEECLNDESAKIILFSGSKPFHFSFLGEWKIIPAGDECTQIYFSIKVKVPILLERFLRPQISNFSQDIMEKFASRVIYLGIKPKISPFDHQY